MFVSLLVVVQADDPLACKWDSTENNFKINNQPARLDPKSNVHVTQVGHSNVYEARNAAYQVVYKATIMDTYIRLENGPSVTGEEVFIIHWSHFPAVDDWHNYVNGGPPMTDSTYTVLSGPGASCHFTPWNSSGKIDQINVQRLYV